MVANASPLAPYTVLVYNSSVPASEQVADYYCRMRGIPTANKIGFAMGTLSSWAWRSDWYSAVIAPLYAKVQAVKAKAVLTVAGCPHSIVLTNSAGGSNVAVHLPLFFSAVKALYGAVGEPLADDVGSGVHRMKSALSPSSLTIGQAGEADAYTSGVLPITVKAVAEGAALGQSSLITPSTETVVSSWQSEWDRSAVLLPGIVGYSTWPDTTHPEDLYSKSVAVLDRAAANEFGIADARKKKILVGLQSTTGGGSTTIYDGLLVSLLKENGFSNVVYWNAQGLGKPATDCLAAAPETFGAVNTAGATARITAGLAPPQDPWLVFGIGFDNAYSSDTEWGEFLGLQNKGVSFVGASNGLKWARFVQDLGGIGGNGSPTDVAHITSNYISQNASIFLALVNGLSICEANQISAAVSNGFGVTIGDPLMRPIITPRTYAIPESVSGTIPSGLTFTSTTAEAGYGATSNTLTLTGFSGPVLLTCGAGAGSTRLIIDGVQIMPVNQMVYGPCTVALLFTPPISETTHVVHLYANGTSIATWGVTTVVTDQHPAAFSFDPVSGAGLGSISQSNTITVTDIEVPVPMAWNTTGSTLGAGWIRNLGLPSMYPANGLPTNATTGDPAQLGDTYTLYNRNSNSNDTAVWGVLTLSAGDDTEQGVFVSTTVEA
jgi:hypothetical protein